MNRTAMLVPGLRHKFRAGKIICKGSGPGCGRSPRRTQEACGTTRADLTLSYEGNLFSLALTPPARDSGKLPWRGKLPWITFQAIGDLSALATCTSAGDAHWDPTRVDVLRRCGSNQLPPRSLGTPRWASASTLLRRCLEELGGRTENSRAVGGALCLAAFPTSREH